MTYTTHDIDCAALAVAPFSPPGKKGGSKRTDSIRAVAHRLGLARFTTDPSTFKSLQRRVAQAHCVYATGTAALEAAVRDGTLTLHSAAEVARYPVDQQAAILAGIKRRDDGRVYSITQRKAPVYTTPVETALAKYLDQLALTAETAAELVEAAPLPRGHRTAALRKCTEVLHRMAELQRALMNGTAEKGHTP